MRERETLSWERDRGERFYQRETLSVGERRGGERSMREREMVLKRNETLIKHFRDGVDEYV